MAKDPTTVASKWAQNLSGATQSITDGVNAVSVAPGAAAARQKTVYVNNVTASADKWARNVAAVSLSSWQQDMITKGIPRIASGAQAAQSKFATFMGKLLPYQANLVSQLPARGNLEQNITRMTQMVRGMANFTNTAS